MAIHKTPFALISAVIFSLSALAEAQTFLSEEELLNTIPGATLYGISSRDGVTKWKQTYLQNKPGKKKGKIDGLWGTDPYTSRWYVKKGKWCEKWSSGNECWSIERVDDKTLQAYKKSGQPLKNVWNIE